jgi:hypothetical protein
MTADEIIKAIQGRIITKMMFGEEGKSRAQIEEEAVDEIAAKLRLQPQALKQLSSEAAMPSSEARRSADPQTKIDADFMRAKLMEPLRVELEDLVDYSDEQDLRRSQ